MECSALAENSVSSWNRQRVEGELVLGHEHANQLGRLLSSNGDFRSAEVLVTKILCSFRNSLHFLNGTNHVPSLAPPPPPPPILESSSASDAHEAVKRGATFMDHKEGSVKRRKKMTSQAWSRDSPDFNDDGHAWRKYGQKQIQNAIHPRSYFRCSHRDVQGCSATKQVQKLDDDSQLFRTTYYGNHTCTKSFLKAPEFFLDATSTTPTEVLSDSKFTIIYDNSSNQVPPWFSSTQNELIIKSSHTSDNQSSLASSLVMFEPSEPIRGGIPQIDQLDLEDMFLGAEIGHLFGDKLLPYELCIADDFAFSNLHVGTEYL